MMPDLQCQQNWLSDFSVAEELSISELETVVSATFVDEELLLELSFVSPHAAKDTVAKELTLNLQNFFINTSPKNY